MASGPLVSPLGRNFYFSPCPFFVLCPLFTLFPLYSYYLRPFKPVVWLYLRTPSLIKNSSPKFSNTPRTQHLGQLIGPRIHMIQKLHHCSSLVYPLNGDGGGGKGQGDNCIFVVVEFERLVA